MMRRILKLKNKSSSLFRRLLLSFLLIIVLLASFNFLSFTYFRKQIREEIIRYNTQNLNNTTDGFENHFSLVIKLMYSFYSKDRVQLLNKPDFSYEIANQLRTDILNTVSNDLLYIEDFLVVFESTRLVLGKGGSTDPETAFNKFYSSPSYSYDYWKGQFKEPFTSRIYPASRFLEMSLRQSPVDLGPLIPVVAKNRFYPDLHMVCLLRSDRLVAAFHRSINEKIVILGQDGKVLFSNHAEEISEMPALPDKQGYLRQNEQYFFYKKGDTTGITYINIVPDAHISAIVSRLNFTLITLLLVAIAISIGTSVLFSLRFNNPVQRIIESLRRMNTNAPQKSRANEFEVINEAIHHMQQVQHSIHLDLDEKNSLLRSYVYTNKLKGIPDNMDKQLGTLEFDSNKPYVFVLFQLAFTSQFQAEGEISEERVTYLFREYIRKTMSEAFPDSHTFQIEYDQILTLVFLEEGASALDLVLEEMKQEFDKDQESCYFTIAVSEPSEQAGAYTAAYERVLELVKQRQLKNGTQIVSGARKQKGEAASVLSAAQAHEFETQLQAGHGDAVRQLVQRILASMQRKEASAAQFLQFADDLVRKVSRVLAAVGIDTESIVGLRDAGAQLRRIHSAEQLAEFFDAYLGLAADRVRAKREERDPITGFVKEYIEKHYREDITLELVADKLDITGGYLSTYFKDKTGENFLDYVHEVRIRRACELLLSTDARIQDIAEQVGYNNLNSFNRTFKKSTGQTPREYRMEKAKL